jgi:hypothetical protein
MILIFGENLTFKFKCEVFDCFFVLIYHSLRIYMRLDGTSLLRIEDYDNTADGNNFKLLHLDSQIWFLGNVTEASAWMFSFFNADYLRHT